MTTKLFGYLAETFIHPGCGQDDGAVDLPVARERTTNLPVVPGSAHKGALRAHAADQNMAEDDINTLFGQSDAAGALLINDLRLLMLPVRSLNSSYYWLSSPLIIERFCRDYLRATGTRLAFNAQNLIQEGSNILHFASNTAASRIFLEEFELDKSGNIEMALIEAIEKLIGHSDVAKRVASQLIIVSDELMTHFARYGLPVSARNQLNPETKASENLWYEETLPPDTLMTTIIGQRRAGSAHSDVFAKFIDAHNYPQIGGNETVGQGVFHVHRFANEVIDE